MGLSKKDLLKLDSEVSLYYQYSRNRKTIKTQKQENKINNLMKSTFIIGKRYSLPKGCYGFFYSYLKTQLQVSCFEDGDFGLVKIKNRNEYHGEYDTHEYKRVPSMLYLKFNFYIDKNLKKPINITDESFEKLEDNQNKSNTILKPVQVKFKVLKTGNPILRNAIYVKILSIKETKILPREDNKNEEPGGLDSEITEIKKVNLKS